MRKRWICALCALFLSACTARSANTPLMQETNMYQYPSTDANVLTTLPKGSEGTLQFQVDSWCRYAYETVIGYIPCTALDLPTVSGPLQGKTIIIDPGHGGAENGAYYFDTAEKDININVAHFLQQELLASGANVIMTRIDDETVGLYSRPTLANLVGLLDIYIRKPEKRPELTPLIDELEQILLENRLDTPRLYEKTGDINPDLRKIMQLLKGNKDTLFVSIHTNSSGNPSLGLHGMDVILTGNQIAEKYPGYVYFDDEERIRFGNSVSEELVKNAVIDFKSMYFGDYAVLRENNFTSALIELGYMDNEEEFMKLIQSETQQALAYNIYNGIIKYFANDTRTPA